MDIESSSSSQLEPPLELELELCGVETEQNERKTLECPVRCFVEGAQRLIGKVKMGSAALIPGGRLREWRVGVMAVLEWAAWVIGGEEASGSGVGELMNGISGVLEKLGKKGWDEGWF